MKTKLPLLLCILFLACAVQAQTGGGGIVVDAPSGIAPGPGSVKWPQYTVKGEEFSVGLPRLPAMETRKAPIAGTNKTRRERVLKTSTGDVDYSIYIYENPKPRQSLEDFIREQTANANHEFVNERTLTSAGCTGKEYSYRVKDKPVTDQFYVCEKRLYRFVASGGAPGEHAGVKQFFSSLAFGKKTEGYEVKDGPGDALTIAGEKIYTGREVHTKARLISKPEPVYTSDAKESQVTGTVILKVVFAANGQVTNIRVVQGLPKGLTERAIAAARKIRFIPATIDERPVSMWIQLEYNFNLY